MTSIGPPSSVIARPTISGSPPKRRAPSSSSWDENTLAPFDTSPKSCSKGWDLRSYQNMLNKWGQIALILSLALSSCMAAEDAIVLAEDNRSGTNDSKKSLASGPDRTEPLLVFKYF